MRESNEALLDTTAGSFYKREHLLTRLREECFDVLIIGGGATGAGAALDAASRGLKTALIEAQDFSFGTSSRSTKLVHGGIRYLENAVKKCDRHEYALVRDALKERKLFLENAPHLSHPLPIITPVYSWFAALYYWIGLKTYDFVAGDSTLGQSVFLSKEESLQRFPMLKKEGLKGAVLYYDGQFNDARMNLSLILSAIEEGAAAANYVRATKLMKEHGQVSGVMVEDCLSKQAWEVKAKIVINATGPYADQLRSLDDPQALAIMVASQGSHILLPKEFSSEEFGLVIPKTKDGRVLFLLPWQGKTLAGTTDQAHAICEYPSATVDEVDYIIEHLKDYLALPLDEKQILATWSGLRPLVKPESVKNSTAAISRDHLIEISPSKLITIVGGKWTTYRKMAEDVINTAIKVAKLSPRNDSRTKQLKLVGASLLHEVRAELEAASLPKDICEYWLSTYGDRARLIVKMGTLTKLLDGYPYTDGEIRYLLRNEYAFHAADIIARRLRLAFIDHSAALKLLPTILAIMAEELHWNTAQQDEEKAKALAFLSTMNVSQH